MEMGKAISVAGLRKSYGSFQAVKGISFDVEEGAFFAFLGPNGAGKSTTIAILCSLLSKDSGDVTLFGMEPEMARREIGVVFQDNKLDQRLSVRENLEIHGSLYGFKKADLAARIEEALVKVGLSDLSDRPCSDLSGGQRRRVEIARAILHGPRLLLLDEPTASLDPQARNSIWVYIRRLKEEGMTVFLTTHYMEEAATADDIVIINEGEIVAHGKPSVLKERYSSDYLEILPKDADAVKSVLDGLGIGYSVRSGVLRIELGCTMDAVPIVERLKGMMESFEVRTGTLDDAFIAITGGSNR